MAFLACGVPVMDDELITNNIHPDTLGIGSVFIHRR